MGWLIQHCTAVANPTRNPFNDLCRSYCGTPEKTARLVDVAPIAQGNEIVEGESEEIGTWHQETPNPKSGIRNGTRMTRMRRMCADQTRPGSRKTKTFFTLFLSDPR